MPNIDLSEYYTSEEAAKVLSKNSGKRITPTYVRQLVIYGKIRKVKINNRFSVYLRKDIDNYRVEEPGAKSAKAAKDKAATRKAGKEQ